jgi:hypothetical protein
MPEVKHRGFLIQTTLSIVLFTTVILGGLMSLICKLVGLSKEKEMLEKMYAIFESTK